MDPILPRHLGASRSRAYTAQAEAESARQGSSFLADVFQGADPFDVSARPNSIRELVDRGARRLETELRNQFPKKLAR